MAPPSAGNDNVIMETPPAAGNVAGARDSPSMPGSSPSVTCTPAAACAGPSTLAELNALTTLIRINTYSGSTASKDKHLAAPQVSVPPRQPAAPVVIAPPQRPVAPEVSAPPQQPAPEAEEYERENFQWDIPTSSQVVHEDAPASKYVCSKKLFDSQETAEEENPEEVAAAAVKKMLSPNTLRAMANTVMDGPVLQPKKRKRPNKKDTKDKAAAKSKDTVPLLDKLPNNWRPLHHLGEPMLPEHVVNKLTPDMRSLHETVRHVEKQLLISKNPSYPLFVAKVPTGMNFVEKYPADLCFIRDKFCTLIVVHPQHSHAVYLDSGRDHKKDYTHIRALLNDALTGFANKAGPLKVERKSRGGLVLTHTTNFPCLRQSTQDNGMDAWYAILQMQEYIKYADDMLLPENLRNRSGEFFYGYGLPPNDEIELRLEMSRDERPFNSLEGCRPFPLGMPTTYVVYKGRVPGVYDDWEDCRRQVHHFSGNSYKGYPTRVEAEGRYARYLAGEMRDMRRNRMKTMHGLRDDGHCDHVGHLLCDCSLG
ncbi:hypothetical protein QYE76_029011 [Lolium multiflorum]|uniref:Ribonuclease H1 N-terminal domain-containing protein n=1 Tax=Lolium multiflorum TaxID=4521 RepID=A0AAD8QQL6_LOLMU|nr:hypothetical protein QYE76_029011 [Lolium multiflorum]